MKIYLSFGSNLGNRLENINRAVELIKQRLLPDLRCSIVIETEAIVPSGAPADWNKPYLNMVAVGNWAGEPQGLLGLLASLKSIERELGRSVQSARWAPRIIDIDILMADDETISLPQLHLPHPELQNRPFLLHLLALLDPLSLSKCPPHPATRSLRLQAVDLSPRVGGEGKPEAPTLANRTSVEVERHFTSPSTRGERSTSRSVSVGKSGEVGKQNSSCFTRSFALEPKLVGIVNVTRDSFSDGGLHFKPATAIMRSLELADQGVSVIDIGAQSTRPGAKLISPRAEYNLLEPVLDGLVWRMANRSLRVSVDSFNASTIEKILKRYPRIAWINDQSGRLDARTLSLIAQAGCSIAVMHSLTLPASRTELLPSNANRIEVVNAWAEREVERLSKCGFRPESIILDPGIGFGKSAHQSLELIRNVGQLTDQAKRFGCKLLVGHSRKSFMTSFTTTAAADRDVETVAVSSWLAEHGVDYLRVHNVEMHQRWFTARQVVGGQSNVDNPT